MEISAEQKARSARRTVQKLQAALHDCAQQECIGSELFPPLEIHDVTPLKPNIGGFRILFRPSPEHALSEVLSIFISLELLDENSEAVRVFCAAAVSATPLEMPPGDSLHTQEVFKGVYNRASVSEKLRGMLYQMFDEAQQVQRTAEVGSAPIWLTDLIQGEAGE
jgi:hypothetical protein